MVFSKLLEAKIQLVCNRGEYHSILIRLVILMLKMRRMTMGMNCYRIAMVTLQHWELI